jgi:hypothetical protein
MKYLPVLLSICLLLVSPVSRAQYYDTGQDPGSLKWMQIKTGRFTVIYPRSYGQEGINFARALDRAYSDLTSLYPEKKFRIPVIIHNHTTWSNGYVAWAPSRMEIYPTPEQNSIPLDPYRQLALHELTHVIQMESLNSGFTRAMSFIAGQQFTGIVSSLLPFWFLEGDAVFSETVLTGSGRGRSPYFQKQLKALTLEKERMYSYDKIINGSFRNFVPNHYQSGYQMMAWSYSRYDPELWKKTLATTANAPFLLNPVNFSLRKNASLTKKKLYRETLDTLRRIWARDDRLSESESYETLNPPKGKEYINYYSPVSAGRDSIIAVKTSLSHPPAFVMIRPSHKTEKKIHSPGSGYPWFLSAGNGKLVWVEAQNDPRWENRSWSVIKIMDLRKKTIRQLSWKTRYMSAAISPDGNYITAAENSAANINSLVIIDAWNGDILQTIPVPGNASLQRPQWDGSGKKVTVIFLTGKGEGIMSYGTDNKIWDVLIEAGSNDLQSTYMRNDSLFFVSSSSGTDNIYLLMPDRTIHPLTNSRFGASDLSVNGPLLLFSDYNSSGNNICYTSLPDKQVEMSVRPATASFLINRFDSVQLRSADPPVKEYTPVPYRKWQHLLRFHSWLPFYADLEEIKSDPTLVKPGLTLMTQNDLSTLISTIGYEYSDKLHKFHTGIKWLGWYFVLETRIDYGNYPAIEKFNEDVDDPEDLQRGYELTNTLSLPLLFTRGNFSQSLYISASSTFQNNYLYSVESGTFDRGQNQFTGRFYFSNYSRSAVRDISPRWAQVADLSHSWYPFDRDLYGNISTARSAFYFPGLLNNHGIKIRLEAEKQEPVKFILSNRTSFSRSYNDIISKEIRFASADYFMPLAYPDLNLAGLLYLTRIRTSLFYDHTIATGSYVMTETEQGSAMEYHDFTEEFRSFGVELMSDFYVLRIPFMVSAGVQAAWRNPGDYPYLSLMFNIDLFGMSIGKRQL